MNEEIRKNAKFHLRRYAEIVSERIAHTKSNIETDMKYFEQTRDAYYRDILTERIATRKERLEAARMSLGEIDQIIAVI